MLLASLFLPMAVAIISCRTCQQEFSSRNSLFRHLREDQRCRPDALNNEETRRKTRSFALSLAYLHPPGGLAALRRSTRVGQARLRPSVLQQDCAAANDIMVVTTTSDGLDALLEQLAPLRINAIKHLDESFHAERSCTQLVYHYLLPLRWLPEGDLLEEWARTDVRVPPPTDSLQRLKRALQSAVSPTSESLQTSRFGALAYKCRRPFHNFCDASGPASSPNQEPVWRVVDKAGVVDVVKGTTLVLEFRGDAFCTGQIQRLVAMAVMITHQWLPEDTLQSWLSPDYVLPSPRAPDYRMYLAQSRFHFRELIAGGSSMFDTEIGGKIVEYHDDAVRWVQETLLEAPSVVGEADWLDHWKQSTPQLLESLCRAQHSPQSRPEVGKLSEMPLRYSDVFQKLKHIRDNERWPNTSAARSTVIKDTSGGSFTIMRPDCAGILAPAGNSLFPDLVEAVFALEDALACSSRRRVSSHGSLLVAERRPPSTHCAVNCNAQFTPHVDSGRGAGQSLSMIVGLGDFHGGRLAVEKNEFDIRYSPLEFDGWRLRHWTTPFVGERFSLVWFTPE